MYPFVPGHAHKLFSELLLVFPLGPTISQVDFLENALETKVMMGVLGCCWWWGVIRTGDTCAGVASLVGGQRLVLMILSVEGEGGVKTKGTPKDTSKGNWGSGIDQVRIGVKGVIDCGLRKLSYVHAMHLCLGVQSFYEFS